MMILGNRPPTLFSIPRSNINLKRAFSAEYHKNDDYQYLQKSEIPMLHFQRSLPRLKIPELKMTCDRFLAAIKPLSQHRPSFKYFEKSVEIFRTTGTGPKLQKLLQQYDHANKGTSYIWKPLYEMYLSDRKPLPINYNPALIMKPDTRPEYNDQLLRTSNLVVTSLRFMRSLREEILEPEVYHLNATKSDTPRYRELLTKTPQSIATFVSYAFNAFPLDMSQYQGLFGATRIPQLGQDVIQRFEKTSHICVMRNGHFYAVNVLDNDGDIVPPNVILGRLKFILNDEATKKKAEYPLGVLTAENRDTWAKVREHLVQNHNENALNMIDSALFCVSMDDNEVYSAEDPAKNLLHGGEHGDLYPVENPEFQVKNMLNEEEYGDVYTNKDPIVPLVRNILHGNKNGLINRWFDKSFTLIVTEDGNAGINFEHSWGGDNAVLRYFNEIYKETTSKPFLHPEDINRAVDDEVMKNINKIEFNLDDFSKAAILTAKSNYTNTINSLNMHTMINNVTTKSYCKNHKISPDAVVQLGIQWAYFKQNAEYVGTHESCSTATFRHGRTETIRPCSMSTKLFCDALSGRKDFCEQYILKNVIKICSKAHVRLMNEAAMGQGFDRHLLGLRYIAEMHEIPLDPLFESDGYHKLNHTILSTSSLSCDGLLAVSFGPAVKDGYGICYGVQDTMMGVIFTSYADQKNGSEFVDCLAESFHDIASIMDSKRKTEDFYD